MKKEHAGRYGPCPKCKGVPVCRYWFDKSTAGPDRPR